MQIVLLGWSFQASFWHFLRSFFCSVRPVDGAFVCSKFSEYLLHMKSEGGSWHHCRFFFCVCVGFFFFQFLGSSSKLLTTSGIQSMESSRQDVSTASKDVKKFGR